MKRRTPVLIATVALAALAACGGEPTPIPTPEASVSATPTPSPTPTGPVRFPDDPNWTPNQSAAVQAVDRYLEVLGTLMRDPDNADYAALFSVAAEPQYLTDRNRIDRMRLSNSRLEGGFSTPVHRSVDAEVTVDGSQQIVLRQCQEDAPDAKGYVGDVEQDLGNPRIEYEYAVQRVEADADWRVVRRTEVSDSC
jgi:predicted small lipoprotein YifL